MRKAIVQAPHIVVGRLANDGRRRDALRVERADGEHLRTAAAVTDDGQSIARR